MNKNKLLKTFVINLDDYEYNYIKQKPYLENIGLDVQRFKGINALKDEHLKYTSYIYFIALEFSPKSTIGCSLSHILLYNYIYNNYYNNDDEYYLILEDDAYPLDIYDSKDIFYNTVAETVKEITQIDSNWEIINLYTAGLLHNTNLINMANASTAAYLISKRGLQTLINMKVSWHHDIVLNIIAKKYKAKNNLFNTNEEHSTNRIETNTYLSRVKETLLSYIINIDGFSYKQVLSYKCLRIKNKEYTANDLIDFFVLFITILSILMYIICKNRNQTQK